MQVQIPLALKLNDDATFENFCVGNNASVLQYLKSLTTASNAEAFVYLYGEGGSGKSHLLQACCHDYANKGLITAYVPLSEHWQLQPEMLQGLEQMDLVCLDDIEKVLGQAHWEEALFHLYNRIRETDAELVVSAPSPPQQLQCQLADLNSRLCSALVFQLVGLDDTQKVAALQMRAERRGLELPKEVCMYLLNRFPRNMAALFDIFEMLDRASMIAKHRITIPFVKKVLE
ncbi:MAG: DnaA regulatory inactivator Hda [Gammaproteobacteria bacterium]|nr:DnaA regulatory inactivator Hda [Gammaproteobacteria bacterium]MCH9744508.1 DnaA regulatory inactivator Hda [Gammaproteobacteria bacterium]